MMAPVRQQTVDIIAHSLMNWVVIDLDLSMWYSGDPVAHLPFTDTPGFAFWPCGEFSISHLLHDRRIDLGVINKVDWGWDCHILGVSAAVRSPGILGHPFRWRRTAGLAANSTVGVWVALALGDARGRTLAMTRSRGQSGATAAEARLHMWKKNTIMSTNFLSTNLIL